MKGSVKIKIFLYGFILLFFTVNLNSEQKEWVCSLSAFSGTVSQEKSFLLRHFPLLIYHRISAYESHLLTEEEREYGSREERENEKEELISQWESLLKERDSLIFQDNPEKYKTLSQKLSELKETLDRPVRNPSEENSTTQSLPLRIAIPGGGALLFDSPETALEKGSDLVLSGFIGQAGDYLLIEVTGRYLMNDKVISLWTGTGRMDELDRMAQEASDTLKTYLLGRDWAALNINVQPGGGQIFLDGTPIGTGQATRETLKPGKAQLEIRLPGYNIYTEEIELKPFQRINREIILSAGEEDLVEIISQPAGADVIQGSSYLGLTPLFVNRPVQEVSLSLSLDGYDRIVTFIGPQSTKSLQFNFTSGRIDWEEQRILTKDKFYNSLGLFTLSLAAPIVLYGTVENQASLVNGYSAAYQTSPSQDLLDKYNLAYDSYNLSYGAFWGTLAVSGVLLGVSINRLVKYIKASEKSIEQKD